MAYEHVEHYAGMGFRVGLVSTSQVPPHFHTDYEFLYSLHGTASIIIPSGCQVIHENECLIVEKNIIHMYSQKDPALIIYLNINPNFCASYFPEFSNYYIHQPHVTVQTAPRFLRAYQEFMYLFFQEGFSPLADTKLKLMSGLTKLCALMLTDLPGTVYLPDAPAKPKAANDRLSKILNYALANHTRKVTLSEIAEVFQLDMYYLSHFIRKHVGISFQDYLARIRLDHALRLLEADPKRKLADVSYEAGFSDVRYLAKAIESSFNCSVDDFCRQLATDPGPSALRSKPLSSKSISFPSFPFVPHDINSYIARSDEILDILRRHMSGSSSGTL